MTGKRCRAGGGTWSSRACLHEGWAMGVPRVRVSDFSGVMQNSTDLLWAGADMLLRWSDTWPV